MSFTLIWARQIKSLWGICPGYFIFQERIFAIVQGAHISVLLFQVLVVWFFPFDYNFPNIFSRTFRGNFAAPSFSIPDNLVKFKSILSFSRHSLIFKLFQHQKNTISLLNKIWSCSRNDLCEGYPFCLFGFFYDVIILFWYWSSYFILNVSIFLSITKVFYFALF